MRFKTIGLLVFALLLNSTISSQSSAGDTSPIELGVLTGFITIAKDADFEQHEFFANYRLPLRVQLGAGWHMTPTLVAVAGSLRSEDDETSFVGSSGLNLSLGKNENRLQFDIGTRSSILSKSGFEAEDFGGAFEFILHVGLRFHLTRNLRIGSRLQHMSNANIHDKNPGLNLWVIDVGYNF